MSEKDLTAPSGRSPVSSTEEVKIRDKKTLTGDEREVSNLEQYILSQNVDLTQNFHNSNKDLFKYLTFRQINGNGAQMVNKLRGIDNLNVFYKIKTSVLSLLQPKIRLYKVNYEETRVDDAGIPIPGTVEKLSVPCYKEFKFSDNFGQETASTVLDYLAYESTRPTYRNVGLKSFSIEQDGESQGPIEQNIVCKLVLKFKSLKDLQASPPGEPPPNKGGLRYVDLILWAPAKFAKDSEKVNPKHYEIKVLVGYTAPSRESLKGLNLTAEDERAIANIEKLNTMLALSLLEYDLSIQDDGQVELSATYRGRLETVIGTNQVNIFHDSFKVSQAGGFEMVDKTVK